jgi:hypothetical protein
MLTACLLHRRQRCPQLGRLDVFLALLTLQQTLQKGTDIELDAEIALRCLLLGLLVVKAELSSGDPVQLALQEPDGKLGREGIADGRGGWGVFDLASLS